MEELNEYDQRARIFDTATLTREYLFSQNLKNLIIGISDEDMRQQIILACQDKAAEYRKATVWNEWYKQFAKQITRAKTRTLSNMPDKEIQNYEFGDYAIDDRGLHYYDQNTEFYRDFCKGTPVVVSRIYENIDGEPEKIELTYKVRGKWRKINCERLTVSDARKAISLAESGISIDSLTSALFVGYITDFIAMNDGTIEVVPSVERLGWFRDEFIPFDNKYAFDGAAGDKVRYEAVRCKGELGKWVEESNRIRSNPIVRMTLDAGLASPLLSKLNGQMFLVHLWGTTEAGKSVATLWALSAWGEAEQLFVTFNATTVGLERLELFYKHVPLVLDELQTIKDKYNNTDKMIYNICSGVSKVRGNKLGGNDEQLFWRNVILTTGEQPLTDDNSGGGAKNRAIELHCDGKLFDDVQRTLEVMRNNYGMAGKAYINDFVKPHLSDGNLMKAYKYICAELAKHSFTDKQRNSIALMCLADAGYNTLFRGMELPEAMVDALNFYRNHADMFTDKEEIKIGKRSYDDFISWVVMNGNKFNPPYAGDVYGLIEGDYVYVLPKALDNWSFESGIAKKAALAEWREQGKLRCGSKDYRVIKKIDSMPDTKCYAVRLKGAEYTQLAILNHPVHPDGF